MDVPEFPKYGKTPRLNREIVVTEKIDGTNVCVYVSEEGEVIAGGRSRWLHQLDDGHGFFWWVRDHAEELKNLGPGVHRGEWWGTGIQKRHRNNGSKHFSLFNTGRWSKNAEVEATFEMLKNMPHGQAPPTMRPPDCCEVVPILYKGPFSQEWINRCVESLRQNGSVADPTCKNPEGVIIYHTAANLSFKVTLERDDEWKGKQDE